MTANDEAREAPNSESSIPQPVKTPPDDYDTPWKDVVGRFFPELVAFFAPKLFQRIDWNVGYEFLEQELREVLRDSETGPRRVDKVVRIHTLEGKDLFLVLHVEIQVSRESDFPQRMFIYYIRLYELFPERVASLAILGDEDPNWKPRSYKHRQDDTAVVFRFRTVKLWEYNDRWAELERDPNPFALVVMAHLKTKATRGDARERLRWKIELVRQLYERGYERKDILELFRLIDWLLTLPKDMERSFRTTIDTMEQESKMRYVTSIERLSREEGQKDGFLEMFLSLAEERFGPPDESLRKTLEKASREQIMKWAKRLLSASSLDEVFAT